ncbi:MAG: ComF family protein, partial [Chloroflexota bacterium]
MVFPPRCVGCGWLGSHFCGACVGALQPVRPPWCASCGCSLSSAPTSTAGPERYCADCRPAPLPLAGVRSVGLFDGPLRRAVHRLKYRGRRSAARTLGELLVSPARALDLGTGGADGAAWP